jgi:histidyl-tRNA synthetase
MSDNTKFGPPKGMRDWLPQETLLRQKLIRLIESHYQRYGFQPIDTPVMENIEVLQGKGGGENEKLMFKILKRGEELEKTSGLSDLADMGLRFDLTVPLARYYANHVNDLPKPFRCYHIGPVWRADRPQKGRYREFYQCDIDVIGGSSEAYEVELVLATDRVLKDLNIGKFKIRISDKRLLPMLLTGMGVDGGKVAGVAGALDKLDKQPHDQVMKEIEALGHSMEVLNKVDGFIKNALHKQLDPVHFKIGEAEKLWLHIEGIRQRVHAVNPEANVVFDPLLVRGFDYYTGPVFEINVEDKDFTFSIGGGGRYDGLIEKLGGPKNTPAVGISLGFERLLLILNERQKDRTQGHAPRVFIANNGQPEKDILVLAEMLRSEGIQVEAALEAKKIGQQLEGAQKNGLEYAITEFQPGHKSFKVRQLSTRQDKEMTLAELYDLMKRLSEGAGD